MKDNFEGMDPDKKHLIEYNKIYISYKVLSVAFYHHAWTGSGLDHHTIS